MQLFRTIFAVNTTAGANAAQSAIMPLRKEFS
jgi:hypothetical protein